MPIQTNENHDVGPAVLLNLDINECVPELNADPKSIGWNLQATTEMATQPTTSFLTEVQVSHKQITDRFVELLNLFEDYSKIMKETEQAQPKLKRTQSEQFTATYLQAAESDSSEVVKATVSLNRMQLSDSTLLAIPPKLTCEAACQTYWPVSPDKEKLLKPRPEKSKKSVQLKDQLQQQQHQQQQCQTQSQSQAHTLHIEVESISSSTALHRPPMRQRLLQMLHDAGQTLLACLAMMGENFTYVLFVLLCLWCLYLIIGHYYSFLENNINQQLDVKQTLARIRAQPRAVPKLD
ncbi:uncharacterized protein [Drosophila virilis]|uniref:Uncharacterized protein n=1 Tax=Drosophila virilis TaxID=7244 RepID=B4LQD7_DROVI|nr:uncharacterized protein LOC6628809 [Drosophila virilis]EDW63387.1 uncharacterized protein Dvir_GJ13395 [Drosophila virilis]